MIDPRNPWRDLPEIRCPKCSETIYDTPDTKLRHMMKDHDWCGTFCGIFCTKECENTCCSKAIRSRT